MVDRRLLIIFLAAVLFVSVLHAERARNDNLQDEEEQQQEERDFSDDNNGIYEEDAIDAIKRFLGKKKTTTPKPSSDSLIALFTRPSTTSSTPTRPSIYDGTFGRKTSRRTTPRFGTGGYGGVTKSPGKDACGYINPCKNGGTCKTLSSGRYYCFCPQDYYGKTCDKKFITSGSDNADRGRKDHCAKSPCRNGGECVGLRTTFYCRCKSPYYGTNCDKRIGMIKREELMDESSASEQELEEYKRDFEAYERDVADDTEDLRRAIADENLLENVQ